MGFLREAFPCPLDTPPIYLSPGLGWGVCLCCLELFSGTLEGLNMTDSLSKHLEESFCPACPPPNICVSGRVKAMQGESRSKGTSLSIEEWRERNAGYRDTSTGTSLSHGLYGDLVLYSGTLFGFCPSGREGGSAGGAGEGVSLPGIHGFEWFSSACLCVLK